MTRWIGLAVALVAALPHMAVAQDVAKPGASVRTTDIGAPRHARHHETARRIVPYEPHYYARPVYYRPYPYGVPAPFVFGFGPFW
jgi:hypothetical protein